MTELAILVPVLGRPHRVKPLLDSIEATTPRPYNVYFVCDSDDHAEQQAVADDPRAARPILCVSGSYAEKINAAGEHTDEPLLFLGADDLTFHPGWLQAATAKLTPGIGVVGTQDLCNPRVKRGEHATHFLVTREYAELGQIDGEPGLLCQVYRHNCTDDELIAAAKKRGAYAFAAESIVEHHHPMAGTAPMDPTYEKGTGSLRLDRRLFRRREHLWATVVTVLTLVPAAAALAISALSLWATFSWSA